MNFETTTCISKENFFKIVYYAEKYNMKPSILIISLIKYVVDNKKSLLIPKCIFVYKKIINVHSRRLRRRECTCIYVKFFLRNKY